LKFLLSISLFYCLFTTSCSISKNNDIHQVEIKNLQQSVDSLKAVLNQNKTNMKKEIIPFLTFQDNNAEKAMNFYIEIFDNSKVVNVQRWGKDMPVEEGKIMHATFELSGNLYKCSDSPPIHDWGFSPAISNFIDCDSEEELENLFSKLSVDGKIMMPLNNYGFSQKFGWVEDQFGISWQLNFQ